jgi:hypothetical protein
LATAGCSLLGLLSSLLLVLLAIEYWLVILVLQSNVFATANVPISSGMFRLSSDVCWQ